LPLFTDASMYIALEAFFIFIDKRGASKERDEQLHNGGNIE